MITANSNRTWIIFFIGIAAAIIGAGLFVIRTTDFALRPDLFSLAVTIDITIGIPLLYFMIVAKKLKAPAVTTLIVFLVCTGIATLVLPTGNQLYLDKIKSLLLLTELVVITYGVLQIKKIIKVYKTNAVQQIDFVYNLTKSLEQVFGHSKVIALVVGEVNTIRYGLLFWLGRKEVRSKQKYYSTYKESVYTALWLVLGFVMLIETIGIHLLLWHWNEVVANVTTILSVYTIIFLISDFASITKGPLVFYNNQLFFRIGIRWNAIIDLAVIQSVEVIKSFNKEKDILDCSLIGNPNIQITFTEPVTFKSFYGIKKVSNKVVFNVDDVMEFVEDINRCR